MVIKPRSSEGFVVTRSGVYVWRRFTATASHVEIGPPFDPDAEGSPGFEVELQIELDGRGLPRCRGLTVRGYDDGPEVSAEVLRLPVKRLVKDATGRAAEWTPQEPDAKGRRRFPSGDQREAAYRQFTEDARRPRRGSPITDETLKNVADLYRAAMKDGRPPTQTITDEMQVARSTAAKWVAKARARGFLGPATRGRSGG